MQNLGHCHKVRTADLQANGNLGKFYSAVAHSLFTKNLRVALFIIPRISLMRSTPQLLTLLPT